MGVKITGTYLGGLHVENVHGPSGSKLVTDAPTENGGKGDMFSPIDLLAAALGTCAITMMGIMAGRADVDMTGARYEVEPEMTDEPPRRIGSFKLRIICPASIPPDKRKRLQGAAEYCPAINTLHPKSKVDLEFVYE